MFQSLIPLATKNRNSIIHTFQAGYALWVLFILFAACATLSGSSLAYPLYAVGSKLGTLAVILFLIVTLPGILGRFGYKHPLISIGVMFRRHTGISMFLAGLGHGMIVSTLPNLALGLSPFPGFGFELFGMLALGILTPAFLTSNLYSMQRLGKYWKPLHKLIYLAFWLIVLHIALRGELFWAIILGVTGIAEIVSLIIDWRKRSVVV